MSHTTPPIWNYINVGDKQSVKKLSNSIMSVTETVTKRESVKEAKRYMLGNWEGIMRQYNLDAIWRARFLDVYFSI
jgi:hypothetical protein